MLALSDAELTCSVRLFACLQLTMLSVRLYSAQVETTRKEVVVVKFMQLPAAETE